jgi:Tol biopolymer transport system component/DNA-binding winged helix-turn-helix (wHTH) protein
MTNHREDAVAHRYGFGAFIVDPAEERLSHAGIAVPLTRKTFLLLNHLARRHGQVVDKTELLTLVWPDTIVEENNLARQVSMLRRALHGADPDHEHIATVTGRGYEFVTPVFRIPAAGIQPADESDAPEADSAPTGFSAEGPGDPPAKRVSPSPPVRTAARDGRRSLGTVAAVAAVLVALGAAAPVVLLRPTQDVSAPPVRRLWQLTSTGRLDAEPAWSPDGQKVAYSSDRAGNLDLWLQRLDDPVPIRLTSDPAPDSQPAWSPDGRSLVFRSERDGGGLFIMPAQGGPVSRISTFGADPQWSPDGRHVLFFSSTVSIGRQLYVTRVQGKRAIPVRSDVLPGSISAAAWFPDGAHISVLSASASRPPVFATMPLGDGPPVVSKLSGRVAARLSELHLQLGRFVWSPRRDMIYFEGRTEQTRNIWRIRVNPATLEWIAGPDRLTAGSGLDTDLSVSPNGEKLAFASRVEKTRIQSFAMDPRSGLITGPPEPLSPEGADAQIVDLSPNGTEIAYRTARHGRDELWIHSDDTADRLRSVEPNGTILQPRWSRDGHRLAYMRRHRASRETAVVLLAANAGEPQVVSTTPALRMIYDWSPDDRSFLVGCRVADRFAICILPMAASRAGESLPVFAADPERDLFGIRVSPDSRWVTVSATPDAMHSAISVIPARGGAWVPITTGEQYDTKPRWSPDGKFVYFLSDRDGAWNLWRRGFDPASGSPKGEPARVSSFGSTAQFIDYKSDLQFAIAGNRAIVPITEKSGAIWIMEGADR